MHWTHSRIDLRICMTIAVAKLFPSKILQDPNRHHALSQRKTQLYLLSKNNFKDQCFKRSSISEMVHHASLTSISPCFVCNWWILYEYAWLELSQINSEHIPRQFTNLCCVLSMENSFHARLLPGCFLGSDFGNTKCFRLFLRKSDLSNHCIEISRSLYMIFFAFVIFQAWIPHLIHDIYKQLKD